MTTNNNNETPKVASNQTIKFLRSTTTTAPATLPFGSPAFSSIGSSYNFYIGNASNVPVLIGGSSYATLNSPAFTGTPTAPTATAGNNSTQIATTAYVDALAQGQIKIGNPSNVGVATSFAPAQILLGNASGFATPTTVSGPVTISSAGVTAIAPGVITGGNITNNTITNINIVAGTITGGIGGSIGNNTITNINIAAGTINASNISNNTITNALLAQAGAFTWKGNNTAGTANVTDNLAGDLTENISSVLTITGGTKALLKDVTIQVKQANALQGGFLSNGDWSTFNNKMSTVSAPTANNILLTNGSGQAIDSGYSVETGTLSGLTTKIPNSAAVLAAIQSAQAGLSVKSSVAVATTANLAANLTLTNNGTLTATANGVLTIDGITAPTLVVGDRVLVKNQTVAQGNGIYVITNMGSAGAPFVLTRSDDFNSDSELLLGGVFVFVEYGTVNASAGFVLVSPAPGAILNTTPLTFTQFTGAGQLTAGTGLAITGNVVSIANGGVTATQIANNTITAGQIANNTITSTQIANATITSTQIANNTITGSNIASTTITAGNIANATITGTQIASSIALAGAPTTTTATLGTNNTQIATTAFVANAVSNSSLLPQGQIFVGNASGVQTNTVIAAGQILLGNASSFATPTTVTGDVAFSATGVATIQAGAVTGAKIAANTITNANIAAGTITGGSIASSTITGANLAANIALTGTPTAPTAPSGTNSTQLATTAYVTSAISANISGATVAGDFAFFNNTTGQLIDNGYSVETGTLSGLTTKIPNSASVLAAIQSAQSGLSVKNAVAVATTANLAANLTLTNNGTLTATSNGILTIDGITAPTLVVGDRVLVKNQTAAQGNGIYVITSMGSAGAPFVLTRSDDFNSSSELLGGVFTFVEYGTVNASSGFVLVSPAPGAILNTTPLTFTQFTGAGQLTAGTGLAITGNVVSIANSGVTATQISTAALGNGLIGGSGTAISVKADTATGVSVAPLSVTLNGAGVSIDNDSILHSAGQLYVGTVDGGTF